MKDKRDAVRFFLRALFVPVKGSDTLSLHQKTITFSLWTILILLLTTIIIESLNTTNHWLCFAENLMIGIICSAVVVVITVVLQFKAEQENRIKEHNSSVYSFLSCVNECLFKSNVSIQKEQFLLDALYDERDRYLDNGFGLKWYSVRKRYEYSIVIVSVLPLIMPLLENHPILCLEDYRKQITPKMYNDAVNAAFVFSADYVPKGTVNRFEKLKHHTAENCKEVNTP